MGKLKHLPLDLWPNTDHDAFERAYVPSDIFDDTAGPGAHLMPGTRRMIETAYRRWLGFLKANHPDDLLIASAKRITKVRVRGFIEHISAEVRPTTVAIAIDNLCYAARLIAPDEDWRWLKALHARLQARAQPQDRFHLLVPPWQLLDRAMSLMDAAIDRPSSARKARELQYRDGLILALLSLWPIRRRSIAAMTVSRHLAFDAAGIALQLYSEDTKSKRPESFRLPDQLVPYFKHYLKESRPRLVGSRDHDGLWASYKGRPLSAACIYGIARRLTAEAFGKPMALHDFRRGAATFVAMDAPEKVGLIPGLLQHLSPEVGDRHYNLARSTMASRRHGATISDIRNNLGPRLRPQKD